MAEFNLDAARAARAEKLGGAHTINFGGETFELPAEMPLGFIEALSAGDIKAAIEELLGEDAKRFRNHRPSMNDLIELADQYAKATGLGDLGKALARSN